MIGVALKGLLGRKLRALLTAFAIVHRRRDGQRHVRPHRHDRQERSTASSTDVVRRHRRGHQRQVGSIDDGRRDRGAAFPSRCSTRCASCPRSRGAQGSDRRPTRPSSSARTARPSARRRAEPRRRRSTRPTTAVQPAQARRRASGPSGDGQIAIDAAHRRASSTSRSATDRRLRRRPGRSTLRDHRHRHASASVDSLGGATIAVFDLADRAAAASTRRASFDEICGRAPRTASRRRELVRQIEPLLSADHARSRRPRRRRARTRRGHQRGPQRHPVLPARLRRHRAVRRRVRDRQHALDHGRPADARVRDAAHARRLAPAGAALGRARGARRSACSPR